MPAAAFYMDHNIPRAITDGLRLRGVDVVTAFEDGAARMADSDLLDRSTLLGRVLVTPTVTSWAEAETRQRAGLEFSGIVYSHAMRVSIKNLHRRFGDPCQGE